MSKGGKVFELTANVERYLAALSKLYEQDGKQHLREIIVNAHIRVHEDWSYDSWNGGVWGHALYLIVPVSIFLHSAKQKDEVRTEIREDINKLHNVRDEFIEEVFVEMDIPEGTDWRQDSGLLLAGKRGVSNESNKRIWAGDGFRVFLSHKVSAKRETAELKECLALFGFSAFVAHEDIHPTKAWQDEIENALGSMDGFVALMTRDFHDSDWTDQEVGYALARGVPLLTVRLGQDPYGFIGKFQAVSSEWQTAAVDIARVLIRHDRVLSAYIHALRQCPSWERANTLAKALPGIEKLTSRQIDEFVAAYNETSELRGGWGFNGTRPKMFGPGLVHYLNILGSRKFQFTDDLIEVVQ